MQKLRSLSRSIIRDPVYDRVSSKRFKSHLEAIKDPYSTNYHASIKQAIDDEKSAEYAGQISRYKKARQLSTENIDPTIVQNRSLVRKMQQIDKRKSQSLANFRVPHTNKQKIYYQKIKEQNKQIFERIRFERQNIITKKQLKKQFAQVDKMIMHSRKIKETIKKSKKDRKMINLKFQKQDKDFVFTNEAQRRGPVPLILR